jgi:hypothetical protein
LREIRHVDPPLIARRRGDIVHAVLQCRGPAEAATPKDVLVMGKQIDDMIALDPAQAYWFTDNDLEAIFIANWSPPIRGPAPRWRVIWRTNSRSVQTG